LKLHALRYAASLAIVFALLGHVLNRYDVRFIDTLDALIYDTKVQLTMPRNVDSRIAILDIDEKSLAELGRWPWDRARMTTLADTLFTRERIALLAFDIVFAEPDASSGLAALNRLANGDLRDDPQFQRTLPGLAAQLDYDRRFADALEGRPVVLGYYFANQAQTSGAIPPPVLPARAFDPHPMTLFDWSSYGGNLPSLQKAARRGGFFNPVIDFDGSVRRVPLVTEYRGAVYEALSLAVVRVLLGGAPLSLAFDAPADASSTLSALTLRTPRGTLAIPVDANGAALVPYRGRQGSFPYYSVADVLAGRIAAGALRGKIVLLGTTAPGLVDQRTTPVGEVFPGVEVHANLIAGMLDGSIRSEPASAGVLQALVLAVAGLAMIFAWPWRVPARATLLTILLTGAVIAGDLALWRHGAWSQPVAALLLAIGALFVLNMSYAFFVESRTRRHITRLFGQYVPPELVEEMSRHPESYSMAGRRAELTVLFSDVLGFTAIAETLEPEALAELMNEYLGTMTAVMRDERGTLDKYIGDAIMGFWGAPVEDRDHARRAVSAALRMRAVLVDLNRAFAARGWPTLWAGIGVNTGPMTVGDMGSSVRKAYTVMGDAVNLAARLEGLTRHYRVEILVGEATRARTEEVVYREIDRVRVLGRATPVAVFEPLMTRAAWDSADPAEHDDLEQWHAALAQYRARQWAAASAKLAALIERHPGCGLFMVYRERIALLQNAPLPDDWDGVHTFDTK
jgi:adenylate cyclase